MIKGGFTTLLRETIIKKDDRDLCPILKLDKDFTFVKTFESHLKQPRKPQPELFLKPFNYADYKSSKKGKQTSKLIEDEMD